MAASNGLLASGDRNVVVVEVGPRDGLQNEPVPIPTERKVAFIDALTAAGLAVIETTSFVNPKSVPQLADAAGVMTAIHRDPGVRYPVLIPNERGLRRALDVNVDAIALFTAATDEFANANVGTTIEGTFDRFALVVETARTRDMWIRGYISVAFGCPYAGEVHPKSVASVAARLIDVGCDEVCLADTIGVAFPESVRAVLAEMAGTVPVERLALHFHDTAGNALANVGEALRHDIRIFDSAAGGLGGCPFAPGAPGNLATEQLLEHLNELGLRTGVNRGAITMAVELLRPFVPRLSLVPT